MEGLAIQVPEGLEEVTVSIGVITVDSKVSLGRALKAADAAMLAAKAAGRNRVVEGPPVAVEDAL